MSTRFPRKKVTTIATKTREGLVQFSKRLRGDDTFSFPPKCEHLSCWCAIASAVLQKVLAQKDIESVLTSGYFDPWATENSGRAGTEVNHVWLTVGNYIVDVTASQFDSSLPPVMIVKGPDPRWLTYLSNDLVIKNFSGWTNDQSPITSVRRTRNKINFVLDHISV